MNINWLGINISKLAREPGFPRIWLISIRIGKPRKLKTD